MKISKITALILGGSLAFVVGCGTTNEEKSSSNTSVYSTLKGIVVDELIANGIVKIHKDSLKGEILAQTRTNENGEYNVSIDYVGPVVIEVSCDENSSFIESNGSKTACTLKESLLSVNIADGTVLKGNTTPLTTQLVGLATRGDFNQSITSENLQKAKKIMAYLYGIDPVVTNPVDNSTYKQIITTLHDIAKDQNESVIDIIKEMIIDAKDNVMGDDNNITRILLDALKNKGIKSSAIENNVTEINLSEIENSDIPYDSIAAVKLVIQSLRDNFYSISNEDGNGSLDKEVKYFDEAINREVIKNTEDAFYVFNYILKATIDSNASMNGNVSKNGNIYEYNVTSENNNTLFNYVIKWNGKDYNGTIKTSQDYKSVNHPDDLQEDMWFEINGSLPSTDNKVIYVKGIAHKNNDKTFTFNLMDAQINGEKDMLQIKDIQINGKYFTYVDDENKTSDDLNYIKFNNIELNSLIDDKFEINGTLSINWVQNNYIKDKYPEGTFQELDWLEVVVTCEDSNNNKTSPTNGDTIYFEFNGNKYPLNSNWFDDTQKGFKIVDTDNIMIANKDGNLGKYIEDINSYDLSSIECPNGYSPQIEHIWYEDSDGFANEGYVPNEIVFTGHMKDLSTKVEMNGKITASSSNINSVNITEEGNIPSYKLTLNVELKRPAYPDTLLNADFTYFDSNKTSALNISYNYGDDVITMLGTWNRDHSGNVLITDVNGVKIIIPINTNGDIIFDKSVVLFNGKQVGKLENRGDNLPVIHFNDGTIESFN